jgi:hypothetical protein
MAWASVDVGVYGFSCKSVRAVGDDGSFVLRALKYYMHCSVSMFAVSTGE